VPRKFINFLAAVVASLIVSLLAGPMLAGPDESCASTLKRGFQALQIYAIENDQRFPDADHWMTRIAAGDPRPLKCDKVPNGFGYAFNDRYSSAVIPGESDDPRILVFDSSKTGRDEHDRVDSMPRPARHAKGNNAINAIGQLKSYPAER
jgi:hypothetical protein